MRHPFLSDDIVDTLRAMNVAQAKKPQVQESPLPEGWCQCGAALCPCDGGVFDRGQVQRGIGARSWSVDPHMRRVYGAHRAQQQGIDLEGDWCRPGLPGGIAALRASLVNQAPTAAPVAPAKPVVAPPVVVQAPVSRPPWYLGYTLWTRGFWPKKKAA